LKEFSTQKMKKFIPIFVLLLTVIIFFKPFFLNGKLPIPADTIIGLYHPFRDLYAKNYPNGIPYKNFLITDPVRQQYPWRLLGVTMEKRGEMPLWNPYTMGGAPLAGTLQGALFYPLNIFLFIFPFSIGWSLLIVLQPLLAGLFLYFYLRNIKLSPLASLFGAVTFAFCGFSIAWLEWGTLGHISLWLPLILLSIDKLAFLLSKHKIFNSKFSIFKWSFVFVFSLSASLLAGHFQLFGYVLLLSAMYLFARWLRYGRSKKMLLVFTVLALCFLLLTFIQWFPTLQFISESARGVDQFDWQKDGWFIPWQHLAQFIAPDFFGNPTTLNYWGVWNYGELVGYVGIIPLVMSIFALFFRRDKKTLFFGSFFFLSLIFSLPTIFAQLPYLLHIPFLSSSQPTRLLLLTDFSLSVLMALGIDWFITHKNKKQILFPLGFVWIALGTLWLIVLQNSGNDMDVAKRNLYLPTLLLIVSSLALLAACFIKQKKIVFGLLTFLLVITIFDLNRFGQKFTPFTDSAYLYPPTQALSFLQSDQSTFRIMETDSRILPPNFSVAYHLQTVDGYDPLYLRRYGELIAASERSKPDISPPFGFNRIITPTNFNSRIIDLLGVKYVLSFSDLPLPKFTQVFAEGQTKVFRNNQAFPRTFFVQQVKTAANKQEAMNAMFDNTVDLRTTGVIEGTITHSDFSLGDAAVTSYSENKIIITSMNQSEGFLVLTDSYYPTWHVSVCNKEGLQCVNTEIYRTDYNFRGVIVPAGEHSIVFYNTLL